MEGMVPDMRRVFGLLVLLAGLLLTPRASLAAERYLAFAALEKAEEVTAEVNLREPTGYQYPTGTLQLVVTGAPDTCTFQLLGRLRDAAAYDVLVEITGGDCVDGKMIHFESKAVDVIAGKLDAIDGGTDPTVQGLVKLVTR